MNLLERISTKTLIKSWFKYFTMFGCPQAAIRPRCRGTAEGQAENRRVVVRVLQNKAIAGIPAA